MDDKIFLVKILTWEGNIYPIEIQARNESEAEDEVYRSYDFEEFLSIKDITD